MAESTKIIGRPATQGQYKDLLKQSFDAVPSNLSFNSAEKMLNGGLLDDLKIVYEKYTTPRFDHSNKFLRLIGQELEIKATDGTKIIANSTMTFKAGISQNFTKLLPTESIKTNAVYVDVYETRGDTAITGKKVLTSLLRSPHNSDIEKLIMTQHQIIEFCGTYSDWFCKSSVTTIGTFFLMQDKNNNFVFAKIFVKTNGDLRIETFDTSYYFKYLELFVAPRLIF